MKTRRRRLVLLGLEAGLLLPPAAIPAGQRATPTDSPGTLHLVTQQTVEVPDFRLLSMSPDGGWLLGLARDFDRLCGIAIATMTVAGCAKVRTSVPASASAAEDPPAPAVSGDQPWRLPIPAS